MKKFPLVKLTDDYMISTPLSLPRQRFFYPSEASVTWTDKHGMKRCEGACLRQCYFRRKPEEYPTPPADIHSEWVFALGKKVEEILVEQYKRMGIWVASNQKFFDPEHQLSGEIDVAVKDPKTGELVIVEVKSLYGYHAVRDVIEGNRSVVPQPKTSQLLQILLYVDILADYFSYGKLVYYARDSSARREYDITIMTDGTTGEKRPCVDGIVDTRFTLQDIYNRYDLLNHYLKSGEIPPADYEKSYSTEKIEKLYQLKEIGKTRYDKWKKAKKPEMIGHWLCTTYCPYSGYCWDKQGNALIGEQG